MDNKLALHSNESNMNISAPSFQSQASSIHYVSGIDLHEIENEFNKRLSFLPEWLLTILDCLLVSFLLLTPAVVVYLVSEEVNPDGHFIEKYSLFKDTFNLPLNAVMEYIRWAIFIAVVYCVYTVSAYVSSHVTHIVEFFSKVFHIEMTAQSHQRLSYIQACNNRLAWMFTAFIAFIFGEIFVYQSFAHVGPHCTYFYLVASFLALFAASCIFFVKTLVIKFIEGSFRGSRFGERIMASNFRMSIVNELEHVVKIQQSGAAKVYSALRKKVSPRKEALFAGNLLIRSKIAIDDKVARKEGKKIFKALSGSNEFITESSISEYFEEEDCIAIFNLFANAERVLKGKTVKTCDEKGFVDKIVEIYSDRRNLDESLLSHSEILKQVDSITGFFAFIGSLMVFLAVFDVDLKKIILTISAAFLGFAFFVNTDELTKGFYNSFLLVFVVHPYDIGDTVVLGGEEKSVSEIRIMSTTFKKGDGTVQYVANSNLVQSTVDNVRRSGNITQTCTITTSPKTTFAQTSNCLASLKENLASNSKCFVGVVISSFGIKDGKLQLVFSVTHDGSVQDEEINRKRWELFAAQLKLFLQEQNVSFEMVQ